MAGDMCRQRQPGTSENRHQVVNCGTRQAVRRPVPPGPVPRPGSRRPTAFGGGQVPGMSDLSVPDQTARSREWPGGSRLSRRVREITWRTADVAQTRAAVVFTAVDRLPDNRMSGYWLPE